LLEPLGDVALAVHRGLLADVIGRDEVQVGLGDLDVVTEDGVEPHLQTLDAGAFLFGALEVGQPRLVAGGEAAQTVEFDVVATADEIAIGEIGRQFVSQRPGQEIAQWRAVPGAGR